MFWIVMADKPQMHASFRHASLEAAKAEAERLAVQFKGRFFVLHVVGDFAPAPTPVVWTQDAGSTAEDCDPLAGLPF